MPTLSKSIQAIAVELINCEDYCAGIWLDRHAGVVPRSLYLEHPNAHGRGCFAVGLNPGTSPQKERDIYLASGVSLKNVNAFRKSISGNAYLTRSLSVIQQLGLNGPILWSNLAKCENELERKGLPPLQTLRHCSRRFLRRELSILPENWVILSIGWEAYRALAYLVPERIVIGIPHPTGGFRDFRKLFKGDDLRDDIKVRTSQVFSATEARALWLGKEKPGA